MRSKWLGGMCVALAAIVVWPQQAMAMHISEGILSPTWSAVWFVVAAPFVIWGLYVIRVRRARQGKYMAMLAMIGAAVFLFSCMPIPVPVAGSCSHPCGTGLAAVLVGPAPTIVISSIALLFQALFMAHGGLGSLGANIVSMGILGSLCGYGAFRLVRVFGGPGWLAAFAAGVFSDWATYAGTALILAHQLHGDASLVGMFLTLCVAFSYTQLPLGILEGVLSAGAYGFIAARRPELLESAPTSARSPLP